jgi:aryl-alcohol dehydrogenase-like predicted oxidoreductase
MPARSKKAEKKAETSMNPVSRRSDARAGLRRFSERWRTQFAPDFYRTSRLGDVVSSIALGTYLGDSDDVTDALYEDAVRTAFASGVNLIDTAINYRCQRSERVIGRALDELTRAGTIARDEIVLCTKAGYVPLDGEPPASRDAYQAYLKKEYFEPGVLSPADLVAGGHAMSPTFLADQLRRSLENLRVSSIDYFYLHNPEQQVGAVSSDEFSRRIRAAFEALEASVSAGEIRVYGCATWSGLRLPAGSHGHLSLYELEAIASDVGGRDHHFRVAQLPINLTMSEAVRISTQRDRKGRLVHVVDAAAELGIDLVASAPLLQGQLTANLPPQVREMFPGSTDAQRALAFTRAVPGVLAAAVGTRRREHLQENLAAFRAG